MALWKCRKLGSCFLVAFADRRENEVEGSIARVGGGGDFE